MRRLQARPTPPRAGAPERPLSAKGAILAVLATFLAGQTLGAAGVIVAAVVITVASGGRIGWAFHHLDALAATPGFLVVAGALAGATLVLSTWLCLRIARVPFRAGAALRAPRASHVGCALLLVMAAGPFADLAVRGFRAAFPGVTLGLLEQIGDAARAEGPVVVLLFASVSLVPGFAEEIFFRGVVQRSLTGRYGTPIGVALASVLFGAFHVDPPQAVGAAVLGAALGFVVWRTKSVWPAVVAHAANNAVALFAARAGADPAADIALAEHLVVLAVSGCVFAAAAWLLVRVTPELEPVA